MAEDYLQTMTSGIGWRMSRGMERKVKRIKGMVLRSTESPSRFTGAMSFLLEYLKGEANLYE